MQTQCFSNQVELLIYKHSNVSKLNGDFFNDFYFCSDFNFGNLAVPLNWGPAASPLDSFVHSAIQSDEAKRLLSPCQT